MITLRIIVKIKVKVDFRTVQTRDFLRWLDHSTVVRVTLIKFVRPVGYNDANVAVRSTYIEATANL